MNKLYTLFSFLLIACFSLSSNGQNIFSGEPVQVVGSFNSYSTTPYNSDYRTTTYRRVTIAGGQPTDGRGQWKTTINVQPSGGNVAPVFMTGGGGNGFLFISGPSANRFQNKWVFSGIGQGNLDSINTISAYNSGNDMGLDMFTPGYYTFVFNDCGYTLTNARFYVGYTSGSPVTVTRTGQSVGGGFATVNIATSAVPSPEERIIVRYTTGTNFSGTGSSSLVQATGSGTSYSASFPVVAGQTYKYFIYTSTIPVASDFGKNFFAPAATEIEKSVAVLNYDDNGGSNYTTLAPTSAQLSVSGKVMSSSGTGIARARIKVTAQSGESVWATTNQFGNYRIEELNANEIYTFEIYRKGYEFAPQVLNLTETLDGLNFFAQ